jgi:MoaA/NifB/PqqE/SkfB family radical SAM enzyme
MNAWNRIEHLGFEITNRCDLKCKICNIWKEKQKKDLSLKDIKTVINLIKNPFFVALTGGEPFLNRQIYEIYRYLFKLYLNKKITAINISTNAYSHKVIEFLEKNKKNLLPLSLNVSVDGLATLHNLHRGKEDAFKKTLNNIIKIKKYKVPLTIKFIASSLNYKDLFNVYLLTKKVNCNLKVNLFEKAANYYHRENKINNLMLSNEQKKVIKQSIEKIHFLEKNKTSVPFLISTILHLKWILDGSHFDFIKKYYISSKIYKSLFITADKKIYNCIYCAPVGIINRQGIEIDWNKIEEIKKLTLQSKSPEYLSPYSYLRQI